MNSDVYERLAKHLDKLPAGFPRSASGVEIRILRRLFSPEEAELALHLTLIPEETRVIARRAAIPLEQASGRLEEMAKKGLILGIQRKGEPPLYMAQQFVVGFWEAQVNKLDRELVEDFEAYLPTLFDLKSWGKAPQMRTIPVKQSISVEREVMPYERAEELVRAKESFAVSNCICRQEHHILGKGCDKPMESCLTLGMAAETVVRTGRGRAITREEALEILMRAEEAGLVLQPANAKDPLFICTCCGCCCGVLRSLKRDPRPASVVASPFHASLNVDTCSGCGTCIERCQMEAIRLDEDKAVLNLDRCIGCGLCVSRCPTNSLSLVRKSDQPHVPKDIVDTSVRMLRARGGIRMAKLVGMQVRSKLYRLLTSK
ncbi:MAG: 4Fe-4S binding protein [candidate division WOR-3 bacterium]